MSKNNLLNNKSEDPIVLSTRDSPSLSSHSSTSSESSSPDFILYSQRQEWNDIKPLPQEDGPHPIVAIAYSERFRDTFDYFRAVLAKNELSERALQLTADCVSLNPSNYTIWYFRRLIINELKKDLINELKYIESVIIENAKNYQVWHHRKCVIESIQQHINCKDRGEGGCGQSFYHLLISFFITNSMKLYLISITFNTIVKNFELRLYEFCIDLCISYVFSKL
jgi:hypothetical protein